jgi:hypothetical protein
MLIRKTGRTKIMYYPMTASLPVLKGTLMAMSSGLLIIATSTTEAYDIVGVLDRDIKSTDSDYATAYRMVPIEVPLEKNVEWTADIYGTLVVGDVGAFCDITTANGTTTTTTVNRGGSTYDIAYVKQFISTSKARVILNIGVDGRRKAAS